MDTHETVTLRSHKGTHPHDIVARVLREEELPEDADYYEICSDLNPSLSHRDVYDVYRDADGAWCAVRAVAYRRSTRVVDGSPTGWDDIDATDGLPVIPEYLGEHLGEGELVSLDDIDMGGNGWLWDPGPDDAAWRSVDGDVWVLTTKPVGS